MSPLKWDVRTWNYAIKRGKRLLCLSTYYIVTAGDMGSQTQTKGGCAAPPSSPLLNLYSQTFLTQFDEKVFSKFIHLFII